MKKIITLSISILLSLSTFAKEYTFSTKTYNNKGMVAKNQTLIQTKLCLVGAGIGMFATGLILHQREMNSSHKFEGPGIGIGPNQVLQGVGLSMVGIGIVIKF